MPESIEASLATGFVTKVEMAKNMVVCEVQSSQRVQTKYNPVIVPSRFKFEARTPEQGDKVTVQKTDEGYWIVRDVLSTESNYSLSELENGEWTIKFDEETELTVTKNDSGDYTIDISGNGNVEISSENGDVFINEGGTPKKVATEDHTHTFEYDGGGKDSSIITAETDKTDESGLSEVEIE
jgi:hypothetical protein